MTIITESHWSCRLHFVHTKATTPPFPPRSPTSLYPLRSRLVFPARWPALASCLRLPLITRSPHSSRVGRVNAVGRRKGEGGEGLGEKGKGQGERVEGRGEEGEGAMAGVFNLEKQFAFYGAYHRNKVNILIHFVFVWPIFFTALVLLAFSKPLAPQLPVMAALPYHEYMVLNFSFVVAAVYAFFYVSLEPKSGSLGAFLVLVCWVGANAVAQHVPWASGWKIVAVVQVVSWSAQFTGHGFFEGRAPALLDNIAQAFLMAPYFVLLEGLIKLFRFEPYPGFKKNVENKMGANIAEFRSKKAKSKRME